MDLNPKNDPAPDRGSLEGAAGPAERFPAARKLGDVCPPDVPVPVDVWRYVLNEQGERTGYVEREKYRPMWDMYRDLVAYLKGAGC